MTAASALTTTREKRNRKMKISVSELDIIIQEELKQVLEEQPQDPTRLKTKATSTAAYKKDALGRVATAGEEYTATEKGFVTQIEQFLSDIAAKPGVDLPKYKSQLQVLLKRLQAIVAPDIKEPEAPAVTEDERNAYDVSQGHPMVEEANDKLHEAFLALDNLTDLIDAKGLGALGDMQAGTNIEELRSKIQQINRLATYLEN